MTAFAATVTFDFNSLASGARESSIISYMNSVLQPACGAGCSVNLPSGALSGNSNPVGAVVDKTYNGEGYAVGPSNGSGSYKSETLGDTDGATSNSSFTYAQLSSTYDSFLANTTDGSSQISNEIVMKFSGFAINGTVSFDYEVFPDGSGQTPDIQFQAGNNSNGVDSFVNTFGVNGVQNGVAPGGGNGTNMHSPNSGSANETNKQYIGHWSGTLSNVNWTSSTGRLPSASTIFKSRLTPLILLFRNPAA
jgi:hypothetical protein